MSKTNALNYDINFVETLSTLAAISPNQSKGVIVAKTENSSKLFVTSNTRRPECLLYSFCSC